MAGERLNGVDPDWLRDTSLSAGQRSHHEAGIWNHRLEDAKNIENFVRQWCSRLYFLRSGHLLLEEHNRTINNTATFTVVNICRTTPQEGFRIACIRASITPIKC